METAIIVDPKIDLQSKEYMKVIIEFKKKPAKVAVAIGGANMSLEEAEKQVDASHEDFRKELNKFLDSKRLTYTITHSYKHGFNGVAMNLKGIAIKKLLSSKVIRAIQIDREVSISKKI